MCGINGYLIYKNASTGADNAQFVEKMNNTIRHRGPDNSSIWNENKEVFFGHQRLSIIDLSSAANQPMIDSETINTIVFNGEIFNYAQLKKGVLKGEQFTTNSDTEVILKLYKLFGEKCVNYLDGMFAFAIWDSRNKELFLARDPSGKKPLYYSEMGKIFSFSSEPKALIDLPWNETKLDDKALYHFLTFSSLPEPYTMFSSIFKLGAGEMMRVTKLGIIEHKKYWRPTIKSQNFRSEEELSESTIKIIEKSVKNRMISDVPIGLFLSGGVDSSLVLAIMRIHSQNEIKTFTVGFQGQPKYDEADYSRRVSKLFNTNHHEVKIKPDDIVEFLPNVVDIFDEPLADSTAIPIYFISKLAHEQDIKVVLTGDGADEIFAGYRNFLSYNRLYPYYNAYKKLPIGLKKGVEKLSQRFNESSPSYDILSRATQNREMAWIGANGFKQKTKNKILSKHYLSSIEGLDSYEIIDSYLMEFNELYENKPGYDHLDWMSYMGYRLADSNRYLFRSDRLAMANSVETRSPFLSKDVVDFALSVSSKYKIKNNEPKYILKKAAEKYLPDSVLYRKKMGFCVPLNEWIEHTIIQFLDDRLLKFCNTVDIFNYSELKRQLDELKSGNKNYTNNVWIIYFLINWFEKWLKI